MPRLADADASPRYGRAAPLARNREPRGRGRAGGIGVVVPRFCLVDRLRFSVPDERAMRKRDVPHIFSPAADESMRASARGARRRRAALFSGRLQYLPGTASTDAHAGLVGARSQPPNLARLRSCWRLSATTSFATFLPPFGTPRAADFAVEVLPGDHVDFQIVDEASGHWHVLLNLSTSTPARTIRRRTRPTLCCAGSQQYWECERVGDEQNSCFPYGGCHPRCWWRRDPASRRRCAPKAARLHEADALRQRAGARRTTTRPLRARVARGVFQPLLLRAAPERTPRRRRALLRRGRRGGAGAAVVAAAPRFVAAADAGAAGDDVDDPAGRCSTCCVFAYRRRLRGARRQRRARRRHRRRRPRCRRRTPVVGAAALWRLVDAAIGKTPR